MLKSFVVMLLVTLFFLVNLVPISANMSEITASPDTRESAGIWYWPQYTDENYTVNYPVFFEFGNDSGSGRDEDECWRYSPWTDAWTQMSDIPRDIEDALALTMIQVGSYIILVENDSDDHYCYRYYVDNDDWDNLGYLDNDWDFHYLSVVNDAQILKAYEFNATSYSETSKGLFGGNDAWVNYPFAIIPTDFSGVIGKTQYVSPSYTHDFIYGGGDQYQFAIAGTDTDTAQMMRATHYDPALDALYTLTETGRDNNDCITKPTAIKIGDTYYLFAMLKSGGGGFSGQAANFDGLWVYNTDTDTWSEAIAGANFDDAGGDANHAFTTSSQILYVDGEWRYYIINSVGVSDSTKGYYIVLDGDNVFEGTDPPDAYIPTSSPCTSTLADGMVSTLNWYTPRCAYSSESLGFVLTGTPHASVDLELHDEYGNVLDSVTGCMPDNGTSFYWSADVSESFEGFVYAVENNTGLVSDYGYVAKLCNYDEMGKAWAESTCYNTSQKDLSYWAAEETDILKLHWNINILFNSSASVNTTSLRIVGTERSTIAYNTTLSNMMTNILDTYCSGTINQDLAYNRFGLFRMNGTGNDYDGLVTNLSVEPLTYNFGMYYIEAYVTSSGDRLTLPETYYIYGEDEVLPVEIVLNDTTFKPSAPMTADVIFSDSLGAYEQTDYGTLSIIDSDGNTYWTYNSSGTTTFDSLQTRFNFNAPADIGSYQVKLLLENAETVWSLAVYADFLVTESGTGGSNPELSTSGIREGLEWIADSIGIPYAVGKMILILFAIIVTVFWLRAWPVAAAVCSLGWVGIGIFSGWWPTWLVVLLAVGFGLTIFKFITGTLSRE